MRTTFGLAVPLLLLVATFTSMAPQAAAETTYYTISGRVVSDEGVPLEGARVSGYTYPEGDRRMADDGAVRHADATTDAEGEFTLRLPAGKGWINIYYEPWRQGDGRELAVEGNASLDFTLRTPPPKDAIIEGRVVDANGDPVPDAEVSLQSRCCYAMPTEERTASEGEATVASDAVAPSPTIAPPQWDDHATTRTDEDGRFRFEAYGGPRQVVAWARGYAQSTQDVEAVAGETASVELVLEKVPASDAVVSGRVIDARTGLPLEHAQVSLRSLEWGRYAWAETGPDGAFRLTTVPGWAEISVHYYARGDPIPLVAVDGEKATTMPAPAPRGPQYYPYSVLVDLQSGENTLDAPVEPKPEPTIALVGYVVDPGSRKAVEGARVSVWSHDSSDWGEAVTDATGSFRILVRAGHYSGSAYKEGYLGGSQTFRVTDEPLQRIDILMPRGTTKWAPCYEDDEHCGGGISSRSIEPAVAGSNASGAEERATTTGAPAPVPAAAPTSAGIVAEDAASPGAATADRSGSATFAGEGGGLPPYDPDAPRTADHAAPSANVPGAGALLVALALVGAAALAARRR